MKEQFPFLEQEQLVQHARKKSRRKIVVTSILTIFVVLTIFGALKWQLTAYHLHKQAVKEEVKEELYGGNRYMSPIENTVGLFTATSEAYRYALLNGKPVGAMYVALPYERSHSYFEPRPFERYRVTGEKVMLWYHPETNYPSVPKELPQYAYQEVALSFDDTYTLGEVMDDLPEGVTARWGWISIQKLNDEEEEGLENDDALGIALYNKGGEKYEDALMQFQESLALLLERDRTYFEELKDVQERLNGIQRTEDVPVIGLVVEGKKEDLQQLQTIPYVRAMSTGIGEEVSYEQ